MTELWTTPTFLPDLRGPIAIDLETKDPGIKDRGPGWAFQNDGDVAGVAIACETFTGYIPFGHLGGGNSPIDRANIIGWMNEQFGRYDQPKVFANATYDVGWLRRIGVNVIGPMHDVQIQAPLLNEHRFSFSLDEIAKDYLGVGKDEAEMQDWYEKNMMKKGDGGLKANMWRMPANVVAKYAIQDAAVTLDLWKHLMPKIEEEDLSSVYELECDLIPLLVEMRWRGFRVDVAKAEQVGRDLEEEEKSCLAELKHITGVDVSLTKASSQIPALETTGVKLNQRTATGKIQLTKEILAGLEKEGNKVAELILKGKQLNKARSTFIQNFIIDLHENGRVHGTFNALRSDEGGTVSGRFSASTPNLQQLPKRGAIVGNRIRDLFLPEEGEYLAAIDFSAQEPRLTAEFAYRAGVRGGARVAEQYRNDPNTDYHSFVANLCGIPRSRAKIINLALAYGAGGAKLCNSLGLPTKFVERYGRRIEVAGEEGQKIIDAYHEGAPFIKALMDECSKVAQNRGYIRTIHGRRCRFPVGQDGKRWFLHTALNRLIQGSASDQNKLAMRNMWREGIVPLATVHDENIFSVPTLDGYKRPQYLMETAIDSYVPFLADPKIGLTWGTTKSPSEWGVE